METRTRYGRESGALTALRAWHDRRPAGGRPHREALRDRLEHVGGVVIDRTYDCGGEVYNEGDAEEEFVLQVLKEKRDPVEALRGDNRWPVLYQLSPEREIITYPMRLDPMDDLLEIGAGMGAVTGALARRVRRVDCVDLSYRRSLANACRNAGQDNIRILVGNFEDIPMQRRYDVVTLIGVLEYASMYIHAQEDPAEAMLRRVAEGMPKGGLLYIAIENRLGMKYFAGCNEDHLGAPFAGLTGYDGGRTARTYTKSELEARLARAGFGELFFYYPFPDYKLPSVIYSDAVLGGDVLPAVVNYDMPRMKLFDEQTAQLSLRDTPEFAMLANSFLIEAVKL